MQKKSLDALYKDSNITRIKLLDNIIYSNWYKVSLNKLHETVTEWKSSTTKLKDKYEIDLLAEKYSRMTADILLKKFYINVKSKIIEHLNDDYPEIIKIIEAIPIIIKCMNEVQGDKQIRMCNCVSNTNDYSDSDYSEPEITEINTNATFRIMIQMQILETIHIEMDITTS